jgi:UDP-N-acetylmuramoyl-tripeptide--D-alanyl-D-alanine ligase
MTLEELYKIFSQKSLNISTDTRKISPGDIFFALKGDNFDGNKFVNEALEKGASFIVSENPDMPMDRGVFVSDSTKALQDFAKIHRNNLQIPIIAITGSNGKTTTKELIRVVLEKKYKVLASPASFNNHIGVPLTILSIKPDHQIAVLEMGDNHEGEIKMLCEIARPTHGLITNIGRDHIGEAGGFEANVRAKLELYEFFKNSGGKNFLNTSDERLVSNSGGLENINYVDGRVVESNDYLVAEIEGQTIKTKIVGDYNLENIRAAWTLGKHFEVTVEDIISALENYEPKNNRSQKVLTDKNEIILDAYNANPDSMKLALENFAKIRSDKKKIVILGDMFELGSFAPEEHQKVLDLVAEFGFEAYFAGEEFFKLKKDENIFKTTDELIEYLKQNKIENSLILIKGSRGMAMEKVYKENLL